MALSHSDSINTTTFYLFSCTFSHLEHFNLELVLVLRFPSISINVPYLFNEKNRRKILSEFGLSTILKFLGLFRNRGGSLKEIELSRLN